MYNIFIKNNAILIIKLLFYITLATGGFRCGNPLEKSKDKAPPKNSYEWQEKAVFPIKVSWKELNTWQIHPESLIAGLEIAGSSLTDTQSMFLYGLTDRGLDTATINFLLPKSVAKAPEISFSLEVNLFVSGLPLKQRWDNLSGTDSDQKTLVFSLTDEQKIQLKNHLNLSDTPGSVGSENARASQDTVADFKADQGFTYIKLNYDLEAIDEARRESVAERTPALDGYTFRVYDEQHKPISPVEFLPHVDYWRIPSAVGDCLVEKQCTIEIVLPNGEIYSENAMPRNEPEVHAVTLQREAEDAEGSSSANAVNNKFIVSIPYESPSLFVPESALRSLVPYWTSLPLDKLYLSWNNTAANSQNSEENNGFLTAALFAAELNDKPYIAAYDLPEELVGRSLGQAQINLMQGVSPNAQQDIPVITIGNNWLLTAAKNIRRNLDSLEVAQQLELEVNHSMLSEILQAELTLALEQLEEQEDQQVFAASQQTLKKVLGVIKTIESTSSQWLREYYLAKFNLTVDGTTYNLATLVANPSASVLLFKSLESAGPGRILPILATNESRPQLSVNITYDNLPLFATDQREESPLLPALLIY